jgi:hypothetical protein
MKLELIVPATHENQGKPRKAILPPLGMAVVAALTPPDVEVSLTDENVAPINFQKEVDLVGITSLTSMFVAEWNRTKLSHGQESGSRWYTPEHSA